MLGAGEIILFGGIVVLLLGATQIPKIARSLGEGLKEFKKSVKEAKEFDSEDNEPKVIASTDLKKKWLYSTFPQEFDRNLHSSTRDL